MARLHCSYANALSSSSHRSRGPIETVAARCMVDAEVHPPRWLIQRFEGTDQTFVAVRAFVEAETGLFNRRNCKVPTGRYPCVILRCFRDEDAAEVRFNDGARQVVAFSSLAFHRFPPSLEAWNNSAAFAKTEARYAKATAKTASPPDFMAYILCSRSRRRVKESLEKQDEERLFSRCARVGLREVFQRLENGPTLLQQMLPIGVKPMKSVIRRLTDELIAAVKGRHEACRDGVEAALRATFAGIQQVSLVDVCRTLQVNLPIGLTWTDQHMFMSVFKSKAITIKSQLVNAPRRPKAERVAALKTRNDLVLSDIIAAEETIASLQPYVNLLRSALQENPTAAGLTSLQGLQALQQLVDRVTPKPQCAICLAAMRKPTCTPCIHLFCAECLATYAAAQRSTGAVQCPLCRRAVRMDELIRVLPPEDDDEADEANEADEVVHRSIEDKERPPGYFPAVRSCGKALQAAWSVVAGEVDRTQRLGFSRLHDAMDQRFVRLVQHMANLSRGRSHLSAKLRQVVVDVEQVVGRGKRVVVFSQFRPAIHHLQMVLDGKAMICGSILQGDDQDAFAEALARFNANDRSVLLLHSSTAAAGLTLNKASHVFLLEPFLNPNEEVQAINRVHRIGQTAKGVTVRRYYVKGTVEERIMAWRHREEEAAGRQTGELSVLAGEGLSRECGGEVLRFIAGIEEFPGRQQGREMEED